VEEKKKEFGQLNEYQSGKANTNLICYLFSLRLFFNIDCHHKTIFLCRIL